MMRALYVVFVIATLAAGALLPAAARANEDEPVAEFFMGGQFSARWDCDHRLTKRERLGIFFWLPPKPPPWDNDYDLCCGCFWFDELGQPPGSGKLTVWADPEVSIPGMSTTYDLKRKKFAIRGTQGFAQRCWPSATGTESWAEILAVAEGEPLWFDIETYGKGNVREGDSTGCFCEFNEKSR